MPWPPPQRSPYKLQMTVQLILDVTISQVQFLYNLLSLSLNVAQTLKPSQPKRRIKIGQCMLDDLLDAGLAPNDRSI
jgi:hypothetical protein